MGNPPILSSIRVAVIQGNIPQKLRWQLEFRERQLLKHAELTRQAASSGNLRLIVWPETAVQGVLAQDKQLLKFFATLSQDTGAHILLGSAERAKVGSTDSQLRNSFNSAFLISPKGRLAGHYNKIRLLPFGEYLPYRKLPWPSRIASAWGSSEFEPGNEYIILRADDVRFGVTICWENMFPDLFRRFVRHGANLMINITNEAWFGETAAPYQLLALSVFRAVENRISIARAANTGVSGFIDPYGRILGTVTDDAKKDVFVEGFLVKDMPISEARTFYTNYGDVFALGCGAVFLIMLFSSLVLKKNRVL